MKYLLIVVSLLFMLVSCCASADEMVHRAGSNVITGDLKVYCIKEAKRYDEIKANKVILYGSYMIIYAVDKGRDRIIVFPDSAGCSVNRDLME
jgi:hypothetical protein